MFKFKELAIGALLAALNLSLAFSQSQAVAGLFDQLSPKRKATAAANKPSDTKTGAPGTPAKKKKSAGNVSLAAYADDGVPESAASASPSPTSATNPSESAAGYPVASTPFDVADSSVHCLNCGKDDHRQSCVRNCRKKCKQTWYPRVAPYCQPGWGWNQPCWRRTVDTYNCPRPQQMTSPHQRSYVPEVPAEERLPDGPTYEVIPETSPDESAPEASLSPRESAAPGK